MIRMKKSEKIIFVFVLFLFLFVGQVKHAHAVMPPDFIFNIGSQFLQIFSMIFLIVSTFFSVIFRYIKIRFTAWKINRYYFIGMILVILITSAGATYFYGYFKQKSEYKKWLSESMKNEQKFNDEIEIYKTDPSLADTDGDGFNDKTEIDHNYDPLTKEPSTQEESDKLDKNNELIKKYDFFTLNKQIDLAVSNEKFKNTINGRNNDYIILDAREDLEYRNGNFPGSVHIRFADLRTGRWIEVPNEKFVYVLCWSGLRGKEVAEFLRTKKIVASYLEDGAKGWYDFGGQWNGNILFADKYSDEKYRLVFSTNDFKKKMKAGAFLVDCREPEKYNRGHISGSVNIPIMHTPTIKFEETFAQVPPGSQIITICDDYVNCFDAKITGVELEARGHNFLGRYNRPWEY